MERINEAIKVSTISFLEIVFKRFALRALLLLYCLHWRSDHRHIANPLLTNNVPDFQGVLATISDIIWHLWLLLTQTQIISSLPIARIVAASMLFAFGKIWNFIALESVLFENLYSVFVQTCPCFFWWQDNSSLSNIFFKRRASFHCKFVERNMWKCGEFLQSRPQLVRPLFLPLNTFDYILYEYKEK